MCLVCDNFMEVFDPILGICYQPDVTCTNTDGLYQRPNKTCGLCKYYSGLSG